MTATPPAGRARTALPAISADPKPLRLLQRRLGGTVWRIEALTTGGYRLVGRDGQNRQVLLLTP